MAALTPQPIDVPLGVMSQAEPDHAGPVGRIIELVNGDVVHFEDEPAQVGGVNKKVAVQQRKGFVSLSNVQRSSLDGTTTGDVMPPGELLAPLGGQLVSVGGSVPRAWNGASWTEYQKTRVLTGQLSENTLHVSNRLLQAPDSAVLNGVTCFVWTEVSGGGIQSSMVGFRDSNGAWIVAPRVLPAGTGADATINQLAKVLQDGARFWVFWNVGNNTSGTIQAVCYDTNGAQLSTPHGVTRNWVQTPGYWDIVVDQFVGSSVKLAQPTVSGGAGVNVNLSRFTFGAGVITSTSNTDATMVCAGPLGWLTNDSSATQNSYLASVAPPNGSNIYALFAYEIGNALTQSHIFTVVDTSAHGVDGAGIDGLTGWVANVSSSLVVRVAASFKTNSTYIGNLFGQPADPALRTVMVWSCDRSNVTALIKQADAVLLQSRAFKVDLDWYAVSYYQSGQGVQPTQAPTSLSLVGATFIGQPVQPIVVSAGDIFFGSPMSAPGGTPKNPIVSYVAKPVASITHNAGDSASEASRTWTFLNANFGFIDTGTGVPGGSALNTVYQFANLTISGSSVAHNNQTYIILQVISPTIVVTESIGSLGFPMQDDTLAGVTASISGNFVIWVPSTYLPIPAGMGIDFIGATVVTSGFSTAGNNGTFTAIRCYDNQAKVQREAMNPIAPPFMHVFLFTVTTQSGPDSIGSSGAITVTAPFSESNVWLWRTPGRHLTPADVGQNLVITNDVVGNNGTFPITATPTFQTVTLGGQTGLVPESVTSSASFSGSPTGLGIPTIQVVLANAANALTLTLAGGGTFGPQFLGALITISSAASAANNGAYLVASIINAGTTAKLVSANAAVGQVNEVFGGGVVGGLTLAANVSPSYQPCWFVTPLSQAQQTAGRWEYGIAYADWRFDSLSNNGEGPIGTFVSNNYQMALTTPSLVAGPTSSGSQFVLPFRAQSFTAGQVIRSSTTTTGITQVSESTVGLKQFTLNAINGCGQAITPSGQLNLPGPMAQKYTASGFTEDGINLGFELPFLVSQVTDSTVGLVALTPGATYFYVLVAEVADEAGNRSFSLPSPQLAVTLFGTHNTITIGGRLVLPTNLAIISVAIYRTAQQNGAPTVQHYKITNDLDVNGAHFQFFRDSAIATTPFNTWEYTDQNPDVIVPSSEQLYTDKSLTPRYPCPAYSQGVTAWNRQWVAAYDGNVWMSGEFQEGDAPWYTPIFRYIFPPDDKAVCVGAMDDYVVAFCQASIWIIPKQALPGANLQGGSLPTPIRLPFQNGGTGWAVTVQNGVAYSSTAGGVWLITRQLTNVWLSRAVQNELTGNIIGMAVDGLQRLFVLPDNAAGIFVFDQVSGAWSHYTTPTTPRLLTAWAGQATYQDAGTPSNVMVQQQSAAADNVQGAITGCALDVTMAGISLAGVRSFKRLWGIQLIGQYKGQHNLNAIISYPDDDFSPPTTYLQTPQAGQVYIYEINPDPEDTATFGLRVFADFNGVVTPGDSFVLEVMSFEIGLIPGMTRIPATKRIPRNG